VDSASSHRSKTPILIVVSTVSTYILFYGRPSIKEVTDIRNAALPQRKPLSAFWNVINKNTPATLLNRIWYVLFQDRHYLGIK